VRRPGAVAEVALDLAENRRHRKGRESELAVDVEAVDRLDQAHRRDLQQIIERLTRASVAQRHRACQRQEPLDQHIAIMRVAVRREALEQRACPHAGAQTRCASQHAGGS
jgi:hypothetical protein